MMTAKGVAFNLDAFPKTRTLKSVTNPRFADTDHTEVIVDVVFEEIAHLGPIPFHAHINDPHDHGQHIYARAMSGEFGPIAPCTIDKKVQLAGVKNRLCKEIDRAAHKAHEAIDGAHSGTHGAIYASQLDEAKRIEGDKDPKPADYPFLHALVGYQGETLKAVGATVRASDAAWRLQSAKIERVRAAAKHHIMKATSDAQAREAFADAKFGALTIETGA